MAPRRFNPGGKKQKELTEEQKQRSRRLSIFSIRMALYFLILYLMMTVVVGSLNSISESDW